MSNSSISSRLQLEQQLEKLRKANEELEARNGQLESEQRQLETSARELRAENKQLLSRSKRTSTQVQDFEEKLSRLTANGEALTSENVVLKQSIAQADRVHSIGKAIVSVMALDGVLNRIVEAALYITNAETAAIMLLDTNTQQLSLIKCKGISTDVEDKFRVVINTSDKVRRAISEHRITCEEGTRIIYTGYEIRSTLYVPLLGRESGVLCIGSRSYGFFDKSTEAVLAVLADYAAIAIGNAKRAQLLANLHRMGHSVLTPSPLGQVLKYVTECAVEDLGADLVVLYEYDECTDDFRIPPIWSGKALCEETLVRKGTLHKQSVLFKFLRSDTSSFFASNAEKDWEKIDADRSKWATEEEPFPIREKIKSSAGLKLVVNGKTVGIIFFNYRAHQKFGDDDRETMGLFANQAAIAIQSDKLHRDEEKRIENLNRLVKASTTVTESQPDIEIVLQHVADQAREITGADYVLVFPYRDKEQIFIGGHITTSNVPENIKAMIRLPKLNGKTSTILENSPLVVSDCSDDHQNLTLATSSFLKQAKIRSFIGVRLRVAEKNLGVLYADFCTTHNFTQDDIHNLQLFSNQAAISIRNASLFERERLLRLQADTLREISVNVSSALDLYSVSNSILDGLKKVIGCDRATLQLIEGDERRIFAKLGLSNRQVSQWLLRPISEDALIGQIVKTQEVLILPYAKKHELWTMEPETRDIESWIGIPLVYGTQTIGLLTLDHKTPGFYTDQTRELLIPFASHAAGAIENARLVDDYIEAAAGGMVNAMPRHAIRNEVTNVRQYFREIVELVSGHCVNLPKDDASEYSDARNEIFLATDRVFKMLKKIPSPGLETAQSVFIIDWLEKEKLKYISNQTSGSIVVKFGNLITSDAALIDSNWLSLVFQILMANAKKAMSASANQLITILASQENKEIRIDVTDTGSGIPDDILPILTKRRIHSTDGSGIGLLMANLILRKYMGRIKVESTSNEGTTMRIYLPLDNELAS